ncbi:MAG: helix-turn-helix domain-containing protein [Methanomassiliicoccus sp.]|nr:helix-turn-helix domain-containing protein [Methanomassiliicoccus sp.]
MPNYEARLDIRHNCPYCHLTERFPGLRISSWDTANTHVAVVTSSVPDDLRAFEEELAGYLPYATVNRQCCGLEIVIQNRDCDPDSVTALIGRLDCWCAHPTVAEGGWEKYRVYSWDKANILRLVGLVQEHGGMVRLESMRQIRLPSFTGEMLVPVENLVDGLTAKQSEVLVLALERGYFENPARISADEMARLAGLSRSTFMEHLRKAENKLLVNVLPLLRMTCCDRD